ncbi:MAG: pitrilysin family protein [Pseudomonadota bacterium]
MRFALLVIFIFSFLKLPAWALGEVSTHTLENGLEIVVIEDHRAPIVTHMVWYRVGAADEPPGKSGIAHYLEHLLFKGTDTLAPGEFSEIVDANGGMDNAFTSYDYTGYFQRVAADRLELMMEMEADRMQNLRLTEEVVRPELDVVLEERNQRTDSNPSALFGEHRRTLMFTNHPYRNPVVGWRHEIENLTMQDALDFYKKFYAPNNAILIVAGDVDPQEVFALAEKHYGPNQPSDQIAERMRPQEPPKRAPVVTTFEDPQVRQPYMIREYFAPQRKAGDQKEAAALTVFAELFAGSGVTSFLGERLVLEEKSALNVSAWHGSLSYDPNTFGIWVLPAPGFEPEEMQDRLDEALKAFLDEGVDADHLERIKGSIRASEIFALDDQSGIARRYGMALTSGLTVQDVKAWPEVLNSVTAEDIIAAVTRLIDPKNSVTSFLRAPKEIAQ